MADTSSIVRTGAVPSVADETGRKSLPLPDPFFTVHVNDLSQDIPLLALCAGFEGGEWRADAFADHLMDHLVEFALTRDEWPKVNTATAYRALRDAARAVYTTEKYSNRGEVGELLLHAVMRRHYRTEPIVSKFYFKNAANDTAKGFDAAHIAFGTGQDDIELWLGESKLYTDINAAIRDVCAEIEEHTSNDYLRSEFMWLEHKLPQDLPNRARVRKLLNEATSLDEVFDVLHVPVLLTYESNAVKNHTRTTEAYVEAFIKEVTRHHTNFSARSRTKKVQVHLCLVPLKNKQTLVDEFDARLRAQQGKVRDGKRSVPSE